MNLRAGMIGSSPGWVELLSQAGIPVLQGGPLDSPPGAFSVIVAARNLLGDDLAFTRDYLRQGGAVFGSSRFLGGLLGGAGDAVKLTHLVPGPEDRLRGLSLIDVESSGSIPREANSLRTQENALAVFAGELMGGLAVVTPFDPGEAMEDFRAVERYFYARQERLPSERVSRVSKGELLHLVRSAVEYLHHGRGMPFASLSPFPSGAVSVCAVRIDTDGGTPEEIDELRRISTETHIPFTWFLDAGSHASWLGRFRGMQEQEVGLHCFEHRIFLDAAKDEENIRRGMTLMREAGLEPSSFAAPFGFWSPDFGRAIDRAGFHYSSEFSWAYDALPHYPVSYGGRYATLQVPVHPVAIGTLRRCGYTPVQMTQYFQQVVSGKLLRRDPLFFYQHPGHREWDVVRELCKSLRDSGARPLTLGQYASWWSVRRALRPRLTLEGESVVASLDNPPAPAVAAGAEVCVTRKGGEVSFVPLPGVETGKERRRSTAFVPPDDIARTREFDLRGEIGRQFTRLQRRFP